MDFLDSNTFEQMAREYNKKYMPRVVGVLSSGDENLLSSVRDVFLKFLKLLNYLETTFKRYSQFRDFFKKTNIFKNSLNEYFKDNFNEDLSLGFDDNKKTVNHKFCALTMLDTYKQIFKLNFEALGEINKIKNCLIIDNDVNSNVTNKKEYEKLEYLVCKLYELQEIFKNFTETLQEFYNIIN